MYLNMGTYMHGRLTQSSCSKQQTDTLLQAFTVAPICENLAGAGASYVPGLAFKH